MSNQYEKNDALEKKLTRVTLLQQTTLDNLEVLGQKLNYSSTEGGEDIKEQFNSFINLVNANHQECLSKIAEVDEGNKKCLSTMNSLPERSSQANDDLLSALTKLIKEANQWRNLFYLVSAVGCLVLITLSIYSFKYYSLRGGHAKYEYIRKDSRSRAQKYLMEVDSLYDQLSYRHFKIKYDLND